MSKTRKHNQLIYIVAGEPSGDILGSHLICALKAVTNDTCKFVGVGGPEMHEAGLISLFPLRELSVMGLAEVMPRIPKILKLLSYIRFCIVRDKPDIVITIDSPDFSFRLAKKLQGLNIPLVHYVAPSVWAWRPKRAKKIAKLYDHLLTLLPFEPPFFTKYGLDSTFIGHPVIEGQAPNADPFLFKSQFNISPRSKVIIFLPGSRIGEVKRHLPIFGQTIIRLKSEIKYLHAIFIANDDTEILVSKAAKDFPIANTVIKNEKIKFDAMATGHIALAASGTIALELACTGTPAIITYKINPFSAWFIKRVVKIKFVNIINLLLDREAIPEYLQEKCNAKQLSKAILTLLDSPTLLKNQKRDYKEALKYLKAENSGDKTPSMLAADIIKTFLKQ